MFAYLLQQPVRPEVREATLKSLQAEVVNRATSRFDGMTKRFFVVFEVPGVPALQGSASEIGKAFDDLTRKLIQLMGTASADATRLVQWADNHTGTHDATSTPARRRETVGVSAPEGVWREIKRRAAARGEKVSEVTRRLTLSGLEDFRSRLLRENPRKMLDAFAREGSEWNGGPNQQLMVRLESRQIARIKANAQEYGRSASEMSKLCLVHGLHLDSSTG